MDNAATNEMGIDMRDTFDHHYIVDIIIKG